MEITTCRFSWLTPLAVVDPRVAQAVQGAV